MKERTFYVINLDSRRIAVISILLAGLLASFFLFGLSLGKKNPQSEISEMKSESKVESVSLSEELQPNIQKEEMPVSSAIDPGSPEKANLNQIDTTSKQIKKQSIESDSAEKESLKSKSIKTKEKSIVVKKKRILNESEPQNYYTLQVGAFSTREQALKLKKDLTHNTAWSKKYKPFIRKEGKYYIVRAGKEKNRESLKKAMSKLSQDIKSSAYIVQIGKVL